MPPTHPARLRARAPLSILAGAVSLALASSVSLTASAAPAPGPDHDLGPHVRVVDPRMTTDEIEQVAEEIYAQQVDNEMGTDRYSLLFLPGSYGSDDDPLQIKVGYYTEVAGLGASPADVRVNGKIEVYNRCFDGAGAPTTAGTPAPSASR